MSARTGALRLLTVLALLPWTGPGPGPPAADALGGPRREPGDVVRWRGVGAVVPAPGEAVHVRGLGPTGETALAVATSPDGVVRVRRGAAAAPENDAFADAFPVEAVPFVHAVSTVGATFEPGEPLPPCATLPAATVWYRFTWPEDTTFRVTTEGSTFDTFIAAYEGHALETLSLTGCSSAPPGPAAVLEVPVTAGGASWLQVGGTAGGAGDLVLAIDHVAVDRCPGCPPPCEDPSFATFGYVMPVRHRWALHAATVPRGLDRSGVSSAILRGVRNIEQVRNDCGLPDLVDLRSRFLGKTRVQSSYSNATPGVCRADRTSVVDFGLLPANLFAETCVRTRLVHGREVVVQADVRFNKRFYHWSPQDPGPGCGSEIDLEGVMTHEWGHAVGLDHVRGESNLTMAESGAVPCDIRLRTLGLGDVLGLEALY